MYCAFRVMDRAGKTRIQTVDAADSRAARRQLTRQGIVVIGEAAGEGKLRGGRWRNGSFDLLSFTVRLEPLLRAEIPLEKALAVIAESCRLPSEQEVLRQLRQGLHEGKRFSELTREQQGHFPGFYSNLLETGEESGCLAAVLGELRRFLAEGREFRNFLVTSSIYPLIVVGVTLTVVVLLFTVFIPRFAGIFADLGREMPLLTRLMLHCGEVMQALWWLWPLLLSAGVFCYRQSCSGVWRIRRDRLLLPLPVIGRLTARIQVGRFLRTLAILLQNHVPLLSALHIAVRGIENAPLRKAFLSLPEELRTGKRFSAILASTPYLPPGCAAMLRIAEESGDPGGMLAEIATEEEEAIRLRIRRLLAMLEPVVILVLALVVLLVVLAVFLAILDINRMK